MNEEQNSSSIDPELEVRIVAMVLGEASDAEREQLDQMIALNPELLAFQLEIQNVHNLLHDVATVEPVDANESVEKPDDWKLSANRRSALLASIGDEPARLPDRRLAVNPADHEGLDHGHSKQRRLLQTILKVAAVLCVATFFGSLWTRINQTQMARRGSSLSSDIDIAEGTPWNRVAEGMALAETNAPAAPTQGLSDSSRFWQMPSQSTREFWDFEDASKGLKKEWYKSDNGVNTGFRNDSFEYLPMVRGLATPKEESKADRKVVNQELEERAGIVEFQIPQLKVQEQEDLKALSDMPQAMRAGTALGFSLDEGLSRNADTAESEMDFAMGAGSGQSVQDKVSLGESRFGTHFQSKTWMEIDTPGKPVANFGMTGPANASQESSGPNPYLGSDIGDYIVRGAQPSTKQEAAEERLAEIDGPAINGRFDRYRFYSALPKDASVGRRFETDLKRLAPTGLDELTAQDQAFSTFSLHVSDVSFKLAQSALGSGAWPEPEKIRIEEFVNAFDYGDPMPSQSEKIACRLEQAIHPFLQQRNVLRVSLRTAAAGRASDTPLRLTFLLDNSGSMERIDRQQTVRRAFTLLTQQLKADDRVTLISFASQPRLLADQISGAQSNELIGLIENLPSEGGTNIESALALAFEKALEQRIDQAQNRIILLTDGAVNLGDADPNRLSQSIQTMRQSGIAFDAAGISARGLNDQVLEALTRQGDGRYYLLDSRESADNGFARQIAGALRPSAQNVKVQVEFNPERVGRYKLLGFEKHRLDQEDFRDDQVDAAELAAAEAGIAMYQFQVKPDGRGDVGSISVRFRDLSTGQMIENRWPIPYESAPPQLEQASPSLRISTVAALFAAKLRGEPLGQSVDLKTLANLVAQLPEQTRSANRVLELQEMIEQARQINGN